LATRDRYVAKFPLWNVPESQADDTARKWTLGLIAQVVYEHPNQGYGSKRADGGRPLSKDSMAQQVGGTINNWDLLTGTGTGHPTLVPNPDSQDISDQIWEFVQGRDVIGGQPTPPNPTPQPPASVPPYNEGYAVDFGIGCNNVYKESGAAFDPGMISVHSQRAAWDYYSGSLPWPDSYKKHLNDFRREYGLPPV
jgi:hypothetical protein